MENKKRPFITQNLVPVSGRSLSLMDVRSLAQNEPENFARKVQEGVDKGLLSFTDFTDLKALYGALRDVRVKVTMIDRLGYQRAISTAAFPILTGTTAIKAINDAYLNYDAIGGYLVEEIDDNKKVTTIAALHNQDKEQDEVKELEDFPEVMSKEEKVEIRHKKNGRKVTISLEMIQENEVADIASRLNALGTIAADWVEEQTLYRVTDHYGSAATPAEPYAYRPGGTGTQLYNSTANNPGTRAPSGTRKTNNAFVDETDLEAADLVLRAMKNERGKRLNVPQSRIQILCPYALLWKVTKVMNSEYVPGVENEVSNWGPKGKWHIPDRRIICSPKVDDMSTTAWYYGAFTMQFKRKWKMRFEYVSLGMETQAYLDSQVAAQYRVAWDCEIGATDYVYVIENLSGTTAPYDD